MVPSVFALNVINRRYALASIYLISSLASMLERAMLEWYNLRKDD
ncbi:hypothetical protein PAEVO_61640 [Paenibacillus sp. GM2FR]|nr:hypothetical protein PAEVO_61640 [Paenibacillus sp. GM2FR]